MTTDTILQILDEMANRHADYAEQFGKRGLYYSALTHQQQANCIGMAAAEIRRAMEAEAEAAAAAALTIAPPPAP